MQGMFALLYIQDFKHPVPSQNLLHSEVRSFEGIRGLSGSHVKPCPPCQYSVIINILTPPTIYPSVDSLLGGSREYKTIIEITFFTATRNK